MSGKHELANRMREDMHKNSYFYTDRETVFNVHLESDPLNQTCSHSFLKYSHSDFQ